MKSVLLLGAGILALTAGAIYLTNRSESADQGQTTTGVSITCEQQRSGTALTSASLFDGPVSENAQLAPDDEEAATATWTLSSPAASKIGYFLACYYGASSPPDVHQVPSGSTCTGRNDQNISCS